MNSRAAMLSRLRSQQQELVRLPDIHFPVDCADLVKRFVDNLKGVGGECNQVRDQEALVVGLQGFERYKTSTKVISGVSAIRGNVDPGAVTDPHDLADVDLAILPGRVAVAENGAIWLDMSCLGPHRAVFVIPQHLALAITTDQIVPTMHEAYDRVRLNEHDFGVFISGPSKTADIEQSLVIGAHGARSCSVFLVG